MISGASEASPLASIRNPLNKIRRYFSTLEITRGFLIALLGSLFIYLDYWKLSQPFLNTVFALLSLYLLLQSNQKTWFISGFFTGIFWFWWTAISFIHYKMLWAIPIVVVVMGLLYAVIFWLIAKIASVPVGCCVPTTPKKYFSMWCCQGTTSYSSQLIIKALGLLILSYIHPFGFDWFKPELMFIHSYIGIEKWQFFLVLAAITLTIWKRQVLFLFLILLAYQPSSNTAVDVSKNIEIITTYTSVQDKWNKKMHRKIFTEIFDSIDSAIEKKKTLILLPESLFPIFLNYDHDLIEKLQARAKQISIVVGGLYWDGKTPYNSTYIFTKGEMQIANKVLLVPFGESNPLPDFLSDWVNKVFYDGAVDYKADENITDYVIDDTTYRNAICFEATSEALYAKDTQNHRPKNMIVLSNNGWFIPSIEPTLQKLLLQYYSKKYGTTIYHSVNMSESYVVVNGKIEIIKKEK